MISKTKWSSDYFFSGIDEIKNSLSVMNTIPNVSAVLFRRSVFDKLPPIPDYLALSGDWLTYFKVLENSDLYYLP